MAEKTLNPEEVQYLSFEGGGGKGLVYLGVIRALEDVYQTANKRKAARTKSLYSNGLEKSDEFEELGFTKSEIQKQKFLAENGYLSPISSRFKRMPLINILSKPNERSIKGISGSSAGAITAFMLAIGMSSEEIEYEANATTEMKLGSWNKKKKVSIFETFLEGADFDHKIVTEESIQELSAEKAPSNLEDINDNKLDTLSWPNLNLFNRSLILMEIYLLIGRISMSLESILYDLYSFGEATLTKAREIWEWIEKGAPIQKKETNKGVDPNDDKDFSVLDKQLKHPDKIGNFIYNALFTRGMFSGLSARDYFAYILKLYLIGKVDKLYIHDLGIYSSEYLQGLNARTLSFKDFYNLTGVDLIITGTNVTKKRPMYFSATHTPEFPVVEAVQISMNIPILFRPIWVNYDVDEKNKEKQKKYSGFWVDGGMLNNYPIHAFDNVKSTGMHFQSSNTKNEETNYKSDMAHEAVSNEIICDCFAGFRISSEIEKRKALEQADLQLSNNDALLKDKDIYTPEEITDSIPLIYDDGNLKAGLNYFLELLDTFMYPSEDGQLKSSEQKMRTIEIDSGVIGTTDFATPALDKERDREFMSKHKKAMTITAFRDTLNKFGLVLSEKEIENFKPYE